ncbi:MAG: ORF6N domain-containing protein [Bacteroidetes bacterium]|nr:ORF6N domain-containing protein [Bacteroidota bacterium]
MAEKNTLIVPEEVIMNKIYLIRGQKVMLDRDLSGLYNVETRVLNQAVRRNQKRFPADFMFVLTSGEMKNWISQIVISNREKMGLRKPPSAFTEQGVAMLSSVLNSDRAIQVNIQIIRVFTKMRGWLETQKEILRKLEELQSKDVEQDQKIQLIFEYLRQLDQAKQDEADYKSQHQIGFRRQDKE